MKLVSAIPFASAALALAVLILTGTPPAPAADTVDPVKDAAAFKKFFTDKFPKVKLEDFVNGPYSMNEDLHRQWEEKEQFPPYEFSLEMGKEMFSKPFKNGKSYEDCFPNKGIGIRQNYPYFDEKEGKVITLELALNRCREANGEPAFSYVRDEMAALTAYIRVLGGSLGLAQDFRGPMAKPHRMAVLTIGCILGAAESARWGTHYALLAAVLVITVGSLITCATRIRAMARALRLKQTENS